ncbi:dihydrodipicolinate synthase family protein [Pseudopedobacter beijingensis]|uniref:Dihydrodipicolinate synthase family protein n=1 Tax=Pseudopedobacter beijingensis TaxID=1207056 RepID=A0ABW4IGD1_9SPHI
MINKIEGLVAAPFTPMHPDKSLNLDIIQEYATFLEQNKVTGAFVCGSTGEGVALSFKEKQSLIEKWGEVKVHTLKRIALVGGTSITECIELAEIAQKSNFDAIALIAPYYFKVKSPEALADFCIEIGKAVPNINMYYYHIPALTGAFVEMHPFLKAIDGKLDNFSGIKFTHEDLMDYKLCLNFENQKYDLLWGRDEVFLSALAIGAKGAVGSTFNYAAPLYYGLIKAFDAGDLINARLLQDKSIAIVEILKKYGGMATGKAFMKAVGIDCGTFRFPIENMQESKYEEFIKDLHDMDFFRLSSKNKLQEQLV